MRLGGNYYNSGNIFLRCIGAHVRPRTRFTADAMHTAAPLLTALAVLAAPQADALRPLPPSPPPPSPPAPPSSPPSRTPSRVSPHARHMRVRRMQRLLQLPRGMCARRTGPGRCAGVGHEWVWYWCGAGDTWRRCVWPSARLQTFVSILIVTVFTHLFTAKGRVVGSVLGALEPAHMLY